MRRELEEYVDLLGLDAYLVGGAVRDELLGHDSKDADFLVPGVDTDGLKEALAPHGRVEDLVVAAASWVSACIHATRRFGSSHLPASNSRRRARRSAPARGGTTSRSSPTPRSPSRT